MFRLGSVSTCVLAAALSIAAAPAPAKSDNRPADAARPAPGADQEAAPAAPAKPDAPPALTRKQKLDELFARLAASSDVSETNGLVAAIAHLQLESGSSSGDLLMARALAAMGTNNLQTSIALLDKIVLLQPEWAEAWNKRATVRYMLGEDQRSMSDIAQVLVLEPRHFGALAGMGMILERRGFRDGALRAYRRALEIAPKLPQVQSAVDRLNAQVEGQGL